MIQCVHACSLDCLPFMSFISFSFPASTLSDWTLILVSCWPDARAEPRELERGPACCSNQFLKLSRQSNK